MIQAQFHRKLPLADWENLEDLLTSAVFGTMKNLSSSSSSRVLSRTKMLVGDEAPDLMGPLSWSFWPTLGRCEPDVMIEDEHTVCLIEAKLFSDFGPDLGSGSQLVREWALGSAYAAALGKDFYLLAVTNHSIIPREAIHRQLQAGSCNHENIGWLSWSEIGRALDEIREGTDAAWCEDVVALLGKMGLAPFDGFRIRSFPDFRAAWIKPLALPNALPTTHANFRRLGAVYAGGGQPWNPTFN